MNKVCLLGRLTTDPELKYNSGNLPYTRFNLAVNRNFTNQNGEREADFISIVAWRKAAELICKYFKKGSQIGIEGKIQTGSYQKENGDKVYTTDVITENITFVDGKKEGKPEPEYTGNDASPYDFQTKEQKTVVTDPFVDYGDTVTIDDNFLD